MVRAKRFHIAFVLSIVAVAVTGCSSQKPSPPAVNTAPPKAVAKPQVAVDSPIPPLAGKTLAAAPPIQPTGRQERSVFYRADSAKPTTMPKVQLSKREQALCKVKVGDTMPEIQLPKVDGGEKTKLASLMGKKATVVVFWKGDRRMTRDQLADVGPDVVETFGKEGVAVVGVAVNETASSAAEALSKAGAQFPNLLDTDGKAFALVGSERLPRTYVLDAKGRIVWFDIEYSLTTRRELRDALQILTEK